MISFLTGWVIGASVRSIPLIIFFLGVRKVSQQWFRLGTMRILYMMIFVSFLMPIPLAADFSIMNCFRWNSGTEIISENPMLYGLQDLNEDKTLDLIVAFWQSQASDPVIIEKLNFINGFAVVWILGVLLCGILCFMAVHMSFRSLRDSLIPCEDPGINRIFRRTLQENRVRKSVGLFTSYHVRSPVLINSPDPAVVLPQRMVSSLGEEDLKWIFSHEISHLVHWDLILNAFLQMFLCVFWFNPLAWIIYSCCREDWEIRCDHRVLKNATAAERSAYGHCLLTFMEVGSDRRTKAYPGSLSMGGHFGKVMRRRFKYIAEPESTPDILMGNLYILVYSLMFLATPVEQKFIYNHQFESPLSSPVYSTFQQLSVEKGVYIRSHNGHKMRAAENGRVLLVGKSQALGNYLVMINKDNQVALIGNCGQILLREGDSVIAGQCIANALL